MDADRLPGGLGVWAGRWFLLRYRGRFAGKVIGRTLYWGAAVLAGAGAWVAFPSVWARVGILIIAAVIVGDSLPNLNPRWGAPVTPQTQPALYAVVEDVAGRLGVSKPDRVWLTSFGPAVRLFPDGRRPMLRFHLAAVSCLTRAQLESLVAHELAALRYPRRRLVLRLRAACLEELDEHQSRGRRAERNLAQLQAFWSTVEHDADAAATTFASAEEAAEAVVIGELAGLEYTAYQVDTRPPKPEDVAIQDVDEGWPLFVAHGDAPTTMDDDHANEARYHRTLADPILRVGEVRLRLPDDRVGLETIATRSSGAWSRDGRPGPRPGCTRSPTPRSGGGWRGPTTMPSRYAGGRRRPTTRHCSTRSCVGPTTADYGSTCTRSTGCWPTGGGWSTRPYAACSSTPPEKESTSPGWIRRLCES